MTDLYQDLGIDRTASPDEVKKAYRSRAKKAHPDVEGGSKEKFAKLQRAYLVLTDDGRREKYDKTGNAEDKEPDTREAQAREIVAKCIVAAVEASAQVIFREDIFIGIREKTIKPSIANIVRDKERWLANIARNEKFMLKVKRKKKPGLDLVKQLVDGMTAEFHRNIARCDEAIAIHQRAIEIVMDYEYEFEKEKMVTFNVWGSPFGASTSTL